MLLSVPGFTANFSKRAALKNIAAILALPLLANLFFIPTKTSAQTAVENKFREIYSNDESGNIVRLDREVPENSRIIVEFKGEPLSILMYKKTASLAKAAELRNQFPRFEQDLAEIVANLPAGALFKSSGFRVNYKYYKIFYGVSAEVPSAALSEIKKLNYVKKIHYDSMAKASLDVSVPLIQADRVWQQFGSRGEGVKVGIFDSGIDYTHPDLGGGFGPGFKVAGGFDFINNDSDPIDDFGHGTHVAGIVAAENDSISGVAPDVQLYAYKVLDSNGQAPTSTVLSGFEESLDPNDDGDFSDRVDIANFSLGAPGTPNDALSVAIDNASRLGMVICAAAGNTGLNFSTIESPGTARLAITVGASDDSDQPAAFSSKGPNALDFAIKPDIVAPGVGINSTVLNGLFANNSGTSMATPHVTGVAALLKAIHPDWSSARIKAAILNSAVDFGEEVMIQGSGRVDALRAAGMQVLAMPGNLSFGQIELNQQVWTTTDSTSLFNLSDSSRDVAISFSGIRAGVDLHASINNFVLAPGDSQKVIFTLTADNDIIGFPENSSQAFEGVVNIAFNNKMIRVPWAFVKSSALIVETNIERPFFQISNFGNGGNLRLTSREALKLDPFTYQLILPVGTYDLFMDISEPDKSNNYIFKENLDIAGIVTVQALASESVHTINLDGKDESGNLIAARGPLRRLVHITFPPKITETETSILGLTLSYSFTGEEPAPPLKTSDVTDRFILNISDLNDSFNSEHKVRYYNYGGIAGVSLDLTLTNQPNELRRFPLKVNLPVNQFTRRIFFNNIMQIRSVIGVIALQPTGFTFDVNDDFWLGDLYIFDRQENLTNDLIGDTLTLHTSVQAGKGVFATDDLFFEQPYFSFSGDSLGLFSGFQPKTAATAFIKPGRETTLGSGLVHSNAFFFNNPSTISLSVDNRLPDLLQAAEVGFAYFGPLGDFRPQFLEFVRYRILQEPSSSEVSSGFLKDFTDLGVTPAIYRMEFTTDENFVEGIRSLVTVNARFDLRKQDTNPPKITSLKLLNKAGQFVGGLNFNEKGRLLFSTGDFKTTLEGVRVIFTYKRIQSATLFYKKKTDLAWIGLPITKVSEDSTVGIVYSADFTDTGAMASTTVDLKMQITDGDGNSTEQIIEPAFVIGDVISDADEDVTQTLPTRFELYNNYPNPFNPETTIRFDVSKHSNVRLEIYNLLGQKIRTLVNEDRAAGRYKIQRDGTNSLGHSVSSGIYVYRLKADRFVQTRKMLFIK